MSDKFMAIGVGQGDAFLVQRRDDFVALIDGGRSFAGFPSQFQQVTGRDRVDVLVCTHNDADHANGIIGFLQSELHCKEVWLPAAWTDRMNDLFDPVQFSRELLADIVNLSDAEISDNLDPNTFFENFASRHEANEIEDAERTVDAEEFAERTLGQDSEDYIDLSRYALPYWHPNWRFLHMLELQPNQSRLRLMVEAIAAGERIRKIVHLAFHQGCRLRWFDYSDSAAAGGILDTLVPVNAREVFKVQVNKSSALMYLALTITNRQSLVFCSPRSDTAPAVLFSSDSDLAFANAVPWSDGMIITTPHHGSESNVAAYDRFMREMKNPVSTTWVRSDGRYKSRPGMSFVNLRKTGVPVFCTLCRGASSPKQNLCFAGGGTIWNPVNLNPCSCT